MTEAPHTTHACTRCGAVWHVLEAPAGHIDPAGYVCPDCLKPTPTGRTENDDC